MFVGITNFDLIHDCDVIVDGRVDRHGCGTHWGVADGDDRSVERETFGVGDVLRGRVSQRSRN